MTSKLLWGLAIALLLLVCLGIGLGIGRVFAPTPMVGVVRFDEVIDFDTAAAVNAVLEQAASDDRIAAVVVEIASPGGYATSSESIYYTLLKVRQRKPLVVSIDGLAASGGYYMAASANQIFAPASSYVGNVGTRGGRPMDPVIYADELTSGPYKLSGGSRFDQIRQLDLVAQSFISNVVHQRANATVNPLTISADVVGEARIYLGSEALATGMIDSEGGRADAILAAASLAAVESFDVADLENYYGIEIAPIYPEEPLMQRVQRLVANAPPDAVYMLDDRISLPAINEQSRLIQHLQKLRDSAPAPFQLGNRAGLDRSSLLPVSASGGN